MPLDFLKKFFNIKPKAPEIKENTFIVWEPCTKNHAEVVPGFVKYLSDLGYHVSVLVDPARLKEGLFSRFDLPNITYNKLNSKQSKKFFKTADLSKIKGVLVTTVGKLCEEAQYDQSYETFNSTIDRNKLFFVEHKAKPAIDQGLWKESLITLRELDYKGAKSVVVNPHYFGSQVKITPKNEDITNFVTIGAIRARKKNTDDIISAVEKLVARGVTNFKVTIIGKGKMKHIPKELRKYFELKGQLAFAKMYDEIEKADFILTSYDDQNPVHQRYIQYQTSGNFQLIYGFLKPCLLIESFGAINGYDNTNSILYKTVADYSEAMEHAINLSQEDYTKMQDSLKVYVDRLYQESLNNFKEAIGG